MGHLYYTANHVVALKAAESGNVHFAEFANRRSKTRAINTVVRCGLVYGGSLTEKGRDVLDELRKAGRA